MLATGPASLRDGKFRPNYGRTGRLAKISCRPLASSSGHGHTQSNRRSGHIPFTLVDLCINLGVGQFQGLGTAQVLSSDSFADRGISASVRPMAFRTVLIE